MQEKGGQLVKEEVDAEDIAEIVANGPVYRLRMLQSEREKLFDWKIAHS